MEFILDQRLAQSSHFVEDWPLCRVMLKSDKTWPWLYLVPRRDKIREIFDLAPEDQTQFIREVADAGKALQDLYKPDKINTAALGNMVPQLHVHVFARFKKDSAWPRPIWTVQTVEIPYTDAEKDKEIKKLKDYFAGMRT